MIVLEAVKPSLVAQVTRETHEVIEAQRLRYDVFAKEMGARQTRDRAPMQAVLTLSVAAARAYGLTILDSVCNDLEDAAGFEWVCRQGSDLGFDGKTLIHPSQIALANDIFAPAPAEVDRARRIIAAHVSG